MTRFLIAKLTSFLVVSSEEIKSTTSVCRFVVTSTKIVMTPVPLWLVINMVCLKMLIATVMKRFSSIGT
jgi:hypothetical protein